MACLSSACEDRRCAENPPVCSDRMETEDQRALPAAFVTPEVAMKRKARGSEVQDGVAALAITHTIDLEPADWMRATWRPRTPLPRPPIPDEPFDPDAALKLHADGRSLAAFAWRLFERWLVQDGPTKDKWAMTAVGHFGGESAVLKLVPLIRAWPAESLSTRAVHGLECLRAISTVNALAELELIARDRKLKTLARRARDLLGVKK